MRPLLAANLIIIALFSTTASAERYGEQAYQIIKATDSRVWRLNTRTGEIAVCSLDGEQLICTSSNQAITPPAKSYAELDAERQERAQLEAQRRDAKRKRSLAMMDIMISAFRDLAVAGAQAEKSR
jgi:hypothetical protein